MTTLQKLSLMVRQLQSKAAASKYIDLPTPEAIQFPTSKGVMHIAEKYRSHADKNETTRDNMMMALTLLGILQPKHLKSKNLSPEGAAQLGLTLTATYPELYRLPPGVKLQDDLR